MCACHGERILETLRHLMLSAKGMPRTQDALSDAFLAVFMALGDDRRAGESKEGHRPFPTPSPR